MIRKLITMLWAIFYSLRNDNPFSIRHGYIYMSQSRVERAEIKNHTARIPLFRDGS